MKQILEGVYGFAGLIAGRVYALASDDGLTLVDAGLSWTAPRILSQLAAAGYAPQDVRRILVTHAHQDHVGGLPLLHRQTGAPVYASLLERPVIQDNAPVRRPPVEEAGLLGRLMPREMRMKPTPVAHVIADGDRLAEVLGGLEVIATPGHAPGHVSFWQPERRILFAGDVVLNIVGGLRLPFRAFTTDMAQNLRSVARIAALRPSTILFGHGSPLVGDAAGKLASFARHIGAV